MNESRQVNPSSLKMSLITSLYLSLPLSLSFFAPILSAFPTSRDSWAISCYTFLFSIFSLAPNLLFGFHHYLQSREHRTKAIVTLVVTVINNLSLSPQHLLPTESPNKCHFPNIYIDRSTFLVDSNLGLLSVDKVCTWARARID